MVAFAGALPYTLFVLPAGLARRLLEREEPHGRLVAVGVGTFLSKAIRAAPSLSELSETGPAPAP